MSHRGRGGVSRRVMSDAERRRNFSGIHSPALKSMPPFGHVWLQRAPAFSLDGAGSCRVPETRRHATRGWRQLPWAGPDRSDPDAATGKGPERPAPGDFGGHERVRDEVTRCATPTMSAPVVAYETTNKARKV